MTEARTLGPVERFQNFLGSFQSEDGDYKYRQRISQMAVRGFRHLMVDFDDLVIIDSSFAEDLVDQPDVYVGRAEEAALAQLRIEDPEYAGEIDRVRLRFRGLPETTLLRLMGADHINRLIMVEGILVRASSVQPFLTKAVFRCRRCGTTVPVEQTTPNVQFPSTCLDPSCRRTGPFDIVEGESEFINFQKVRVQERPEDLPPGQLPRWIDARLVEDLVDVARPGDRVTLIGVVRTVRGYSQGRSLSRAFDIFLETNYIDILGKELEIVQISLDEEEWIKEFSLDPRVHEKIVRSIAPSIYGYVDIKEAIMYLLFAGVPKLLADNISIRGDSNILIVGDPGTAKSQLLQYVSKIAPRGLYTSGRGSTAAGLTAAVIREREGGMTLEAGALVLADRGICSIDEMDKMRTEDRVAIHEAMEQQTVSVAKGGIVATLNARTSILAAANPALGRYDPYRTMIENINLPTTILSRFDLIFLIKDLPDKEVDKRMAEHILQLHKTGSSPVEAPVPPQMLKKYISYAKTIRPILTDEAMERFEDFYVQMRTTESRDSPIAITARQLESLIRIAEARARAALRKEVLVEDAQASILLMRKSLEQVGVDISGSGEIDIDIIMTGKPKSLRDKLQVVLSTIIDAEKETGMVREEELYERLQREYDIRREEAYRLIGQLTREGTIYSPRQGFFKKT
ncbi:MAG: minichromosome maintenance protein MCM [Candidatus Bathyarchaeota archaeon]|nr:minichromosome maintenance protein MCM [Candidatus Bathyarchaeota archaeon]